MPAGAAPSGTLGQSLSNAPATDSSILRLNFNEFTGDGNYRICRRPAAIWSGPDRQPLPRRPRQARTAPRAAPLPCTATIRSIACSKDRLSIRKAPINGGYAYIPVRWNHRQLWRQRGIGRCVEARRFASWRLCIGAGINRRRQRQPRQLCAAVQCTAGPKAITSPFDLRKLTSRPSLPVAAGKRQSVRCHPNPTGRNQLARAPAPR